MSIERIGQNDLNHLADLIADLHSVVEHHATNLLNSDAISATDVNREVAEVAAIIEGALGAVVGNWVESKHVVTTDGGEPTSPTPAAPQTPNQMCAVAQQLNAVFEGTTSSTSVTFTEAGAKYIGDAARLIHCIRDAILHDDAEASERTVLAANRITPLSIAERGKQTRKELDEWLESTKAAAVPDDVQEKQPSDHSFTSV